MVKRLKNDFGVGQRNRISQTKPILPRNHDNELSTIKKLIQAETERWRGKLPQVEEDLLFYNRGQAQLGIIPGVIGQINTLGYGVAVTLTFDEQNDDITPIFPGTGGSIEPRPQTQMHGLGMTFSTPVYNLPAPGQSRFVTPFGGSGRIEPMGGGALSNVFRVASDDDYVETLTCDKLITLPNGKMTVWVQGFDDGDDGNRRYYILDAFGKFQLYYEYEAGVTSKIVWKPNTDNSFIVELDISDGITGPAEFGWFGHSPTKLTVVWDYAAQIFELYYGGSRAAAEPSSLVPMPAIMGRKMSMGNSLKGIFYPGGGQEFAKQHFDLWSFTKLTASLKDVTSIDGDVVQTLQPIHKGTFLTGCGDISTPINLGSEAEPFDTAWIRNLNVTCASNLDTTCPSMHISQTPGIGSTYGDLQGFLNESNTIFNLEGDIPYDLILAFVNGQYQDSTELVASNPSTGEFLLTPAPFASDDITGVGFDHSCICKLIIAQSPTDGCILPEITGIKNEINTDFVLPFPFISGKLLVFVNGQLQIQGVDKDWIEVDWNTFRLNAAPFAEDQLLAILLPQEIVKESSLDTLVGAVDGINDTFTTSFDHDKIVVELNGQTNQMGFNNDWIPIQPKQFQFLTPPFATDVIGTFYTIRVPDNGIGDSRCITLITQDYTITRNHEYVQCDASGGSFTVTLPASSGRQGWEVGVIKIDSSGNAITVSGDAGINGSPSLMIGSQFDSPHLILGLNTLSAADWHTG